jgi:hypothetical protein
MKIFEIDSYQLVKRSKSKFSKNIKIIALYNSPNTNTDMNVN